MAVLELIDKKMSDLKPISKEEISRMSSVLNIINNALEALEDEDKLVDYDFDMAINLVNQNVTNFGIVDLSKGISDIKNVLLAKKKFNIPDLVYSEEQQRVITSFKDKLTNYKKELEDLINEHKDNKLHKEIIENLNDLKKVIEGTGRRKYYTYEMLESLFEIVDYNSLSYKDIQELNGLLSVTKNKDQVSTVTANEVIELLTKYFDSKVIPEFVTKYETEICSLIDLDNAEKILEFFKNEGIINKFSLTALLQIILKGRLEFIKDFYNNEVKNEDEAIKDIVFAEIMSCVWINEERAKRESFDGFRIVSEKKQDGSLCSSIKSVSKEDVLDNINILKSNEDILCDGYDLDVLSDLWILTKSPSMIKKNLDLFRMFGVRDIKPSAIAQQDLEAKMHLSVELGLLNPPRNAMFRDIESRVPKQREFVLNGRKKKIYSNSILNYFQRYTTKFVPTSYSEYIYWFYKIQNCGKEEFYKNFFSSRMPGMRSLDGYTSEEDRHIYKSSDAMDKIINENFAKNFYSSLIGNYNTYEMVLKEYKNSEENDIVFPYYSDTVLEEDIVRRLEEYRSKDVYNGDGEERVINSEYSYVFGETIVSRLKVLHNLTILMKQFGYINEEMLLTAIAYNSYFSKSVFDTIKECIRRERVI